MTNPTIADLLDAVTRAERSGITDEDSAKIEIAKDLGHKIIDLLAREPYSTLPLDWNLKVLAGIIGCMIKSCRPAGPLSGMLIAVEHAQTIISIAGEKDL